MAVQSVAYKKRLENEYNELQKLPKNDLFKVEPAPGQTPPHVSCYHVTYTVPTWVKVGGRIIKQERTVVKIDKPSAAGDPRAVVIEGAVPYHTNWYTDGAVCNGNVCHPSMWLYQYIGAICEMLQFKEDRINPGSAANREARDYWVEHKNDPSKFPTDTRRIPVPGEKPKIQILSVKHR